MPKLNVTCEVCYSYNVHSKYQEKIKTEIPIIYYTLNEKVVYCHQKHYTH